MVGGYFINAPRPDGEALCAPLLEIDLMLIKLVFETPQTFVKSHTTRSFYLSLQTKPNYILEKYTGY